MPRIPAQRRRQRGGRHSKKYSWVGHKLVHTIPGIGQSDAAFFIRAGYTYARDVIRKFEQVTLPRFRLFLARFLMSPYDRQLVEVSIKKYLENKRLNRLV